MLSFATAQPTAALGDLMTALEQPRHIKRGLAGNALKFRPFRRAAAAFRGLRYLASVDTARRCDLGYPHDA